jgi:hypothetical protein
MSVDEKTCAVCTSPMRAVVAALLECGASVVEMVDHTGLDAKLIESHLAHVAADDSEEPTSNNPVELSDERLRILLRRAHETYTAAGLQGDTKSQVSALSAQLRCECEIARRAESKAERKDTLALAHDPNTWPESERARVRDFLDWVVANHDAKVAQRP